MAPPNQDTSLNMITIPNNEPSQENSVVIHEMEDILSELVPITEPVDLDFLTPELLYWLNTDVTVNDWIKVQIQENYKKLFDVLFNEQKIRWEKENLVDNCIIPQALEYIHKNCDHPDVIGYQKYVKTRREILKELFVSGTCFEFDNALIRRIINLDSWTHEKDAVTSKSWWRDVMFWLNLPYLGKA